jgi:vacuolar protein sorting-associated protein 52
MCSRQRYGRHLTDHVQDEKESARFEDLHKSILACDNVLESVETSLGGFQKDLAAVSTEIEELQSRSIAMNTKLENRKVVEGLLGPAVEDIAIAPWVVKTVSEGTISDTWLKALAELQKRIKIVGSKYKDAEGDPSKAISDMTPMLENLSAKASGKIRDYIVTQIKAFRSPGINAQIIQQGLVKHKDMYTFLSKAQPQLASELAQAYVNTMRWYYSSHFERYRLALSKLNVVTDSTPIGADPAKVKPASGPSSYDPFALGRRANVLKPDNTTAISSYLAEEDKSPRTLEFPFRSFNQALLDNVAAEHAFLSTFFAAIPPAQLDKHATAIFTPSFTLGNTMTSELVQGSIDCLGILLCLRLTQRFALNLQKRTVPTADSYVNGLNMLLWPRFQQAMDAHTESIKALGGSGGSGTAGSSASAASKLAFASAGGDPSKLSTAPHVLTQRVAQLLHGLAVLSADARVEEEPVARSVGRLRDEFESFLKQASKGAGADAKKRERFLGNNYALIMTILGDAEGSLAGEMRTHFEEVKGKLKG